MKYKTIIEYFIKHHTDELDLIGDIKYSVEAAYERQLSSVVKVKYFDHAKSKTVFIKISEDHEFIMWGGCLQKEYDILKAIKEDKNHNISHSVPTALVFSSENHALITEEIIAQEASTLINKFMSMPYYLINRNTARTVIENSGKWLSSFHHLTGVTHGSFNFEPAIRWVEVRLNLLMKHNGKNINKEFCQQILSKLHLLKIEIEKDEIQISGNHSDFCPHNILVNTDSSIAVIDFASYTKGPIEYDILRFYNELENIGYQFGCSSNTSKIFQAIFLAAYGYQINLSSPLTQFILCQYKVAKLLSSLYAGLGYRYFWKNGEIPYRKNFKWLNEIFLSTNVEQTKL